MFRTVLKGHLPLAAVSAIAMLAATAFGQAKPPRWFARDGQKVDVAVAGGAYDIRFGGKQDWCVYAFPELQASPGEIYTLSARLDRHPGEDGDDKAKNCAINVILTGKDGKVVSWAWSTMRLEVGKASECSFMVPPDVVRICPRISGNNEFAGRISALGCRKDAGRGIALLPLTNEWRISSANVDVRITAKNASFAVTDRRTGVTRESVAGFGHGLAASWYVTDAYSDAHRVRLGAIDAETLLPYTVTYRIDPLTDELTVSLAGDPSARSKFGTEAWGAPPRMFPHPIASLAGERLVLPANEGIAFPVDEPYRERRSYQTFCGHGLSMAFFGVCADADANGKGGAGYGAIIETPDDAGVRVCQDLDRNILLTCAPGWKDECGRFGYTRTVRYFFFTEGGHVALAKRYRAYAKGKGLLVPFSEKVRTRPNVDRLLGAVNVWYLEPGWKDRIPGTKMAQEFKAAGIDRILWSNCNSWGKAGPDKEVDALNAMDGVLTSRYDCYQDVYFPEMMEAIGRGRKNGDNGEAWPHDINWTSPNSNDWRRAWAYRTADGKFVHTAMMCDAKAPDHERRRVTEEREVGKRLTARFIDTTVAAPWQECYNPSHPMTRGQSRYWKMELLRLLGDEFGLVVGSETGIDAAVPYCDYFEGMLSLGDFRIPNAGRDIQKVWTNEPPERLIKYQMGERYRLPLWELVYHDCLCAHWYWGDYNNKIPSVWDKRDLFNVLYGTMGMFLLNSRQWAADRDRFVNSYRMTSPVARATGYSEMTSHVYLTADRTVQRTKFSDGTIVTVNFGDNPFTMPEGGTLAPRSHSATIGNR